MSRLIVRGLLVAAALTACGQKGPLYLPERTGEVVTRPAPTEVTGAPAPETELEDEEEKKDGATTTAPPL